MNAPHIRANLLSEIQASKKMGSSESTDEYAGDFVMHYRDLKCRFHYRMARSIEAAGYTDQGILGKGVRQVMDGQGNKHVLKTIKVTKSTETRQAVQEFHNLDKFCETSTPSVIEVLLLPEGPSVVTELADSTLFDYIETDDNEMNLAYLHSAAYALKAIHDQGMAHNDVKPDNVLVWEGGDACFCDMGYAGPAVGGSKECMGTLDYVSPERLRHKVVDARASDIWSFGVMIHATLTGTMLFTLQKSDKGTIDRILRGEMYDSVHEHPTDITDLILDCCEPEPEDRPTAQELYERIGAIP